MGLFKSNKGKRLTKQELLDLAKAEARQKARQEAADRIKLKLDAALLQAATLLEGENVQALAIVIQTPGQAFCAPVGPARTLITSLEASTNWLRDQAVDAARFHLPKQTAPQRPEKAPEKPSDGENDPKAAPEGKPGEEA